jgi:hypothetical protein
LRGIRYKPEEMLKSPQLLLIGGNTRHIGKTTLACGIIKSFSLTARITALKVTSIYRNDEKHHGEHALFQAKDFSITSETPGENRKDTAKMLAAGATEACYIQAMDHAIGKAWSAFMKRVPSNRLLVCESRSLRRILEPGLFIYLKSSKLQEEKPYSLWLEKLADHILIDPIGEDLLNLVQRIQITDGKWK